jgi:hypothetical protein
MRSSKQLIDNDKPKQSPANWGDLGHEPRNENLANIRGLGSFEKKENAREKESKQKDKKVN